jgi:type I restriction enzyme S subunit
LDAGKQELEKAAQQLKMYRQAVLKWAFEGRLTNEVKNDIELPDGWQLVPFKELIHKIRSGTGSPPTSTNSAYPILRSSSVRNGRIDFEDVKFIADESTIRPDDFVQPNDLLFTRLNGSLDYVGNCARVPKAFPTNLLYPDRLFRVRLNNPEIARFIMYYFAGPNARRLIESKAKSTAGHMRISTPDITEMPVPICPINEQRKVVQEIEARLSVCDRIEETIAETLHQSEVLRQTILSRAFEGKLLN